MNEVKSKNEEKAKSSAAQLERHHDSSSWTVMWLILTLVAAFGVAGAYIEKRLESLEEKVVAQSGALSEQAFEQSKVTQKEILTNRAESASIAASMSNLMEEVSQMMNESIQSFTAQTQQLAAAVELKEKNQAELLKSKLEKLGILTEEQNLGIQAAIESLAKEVADTKTIVLASQKQSNQLESHIAKLTQQLNDIESNLHSGLVSLTDLVEKQNELITSQFALRSEELSSGLAAVREQSSQSFQEVNTQIASLESAQSKSAKTVHQTIADSAHALTNTITGLQNRLTDISDQMELSQATNEFNSEVIHSELSTIRNSLDIRTGDLLVEAGEIQKSIQGLQQNDIQSQLQELAGMFEDANLKVTEKQLSAIQEGFEAFRQELAQIETGLTGKLDGVTKRLEEAQLSQYDTQHQELLDQLKTITDDVGGFPKHLSEGLSKAQGILQEMDESSPTDETLAALDSILRELSASVKNTQEQVERIKTKISGLTEKLTEITHVPIREVIQNVPTKESGDAAVTHKEHKDTVQP